MGAAGQLEVLQTGEPCKEIGREGAWLSLFDVESAKPAPDARSAFVVAHRKKMRPATAVITRPKRL